MERLPVAVDDLARLLGIVVVRRRFEDADVSGMLFRGEREVIGVNEVHHRVRQRFTIAHELGHHVLHPGRELILDAPVRVNFRDRTSSMATDREEIEANAFAAALLMPEPMIRAELDRLPEEIRRDVDLTIKVLADRFEVSIAALGFRLINLGLTS
ncbi:ImmA/IrrE family metallo-endopeptidase [Actinospica durhamensis]|uniref:ImmA/IrrE family metallo-endopeptidase n=1 Tax=Actinospica durhamensis TaxID=1508375 RepID=A0A941EVQ5_9ACTN|nr:ImmA/IrrE family metallo-endopeptidase [Actinospica durhamensis]MBR7837816.1 ImmA/IrrE family metallo-endopeptidase [Actinospica durhamensis]